MEAKIMEKYFDDINGVVLTITLSEPDNYEAGQSIDIYHVRDEATSKQTELIFVLIGWALEHGLKNLGHYSVNGVWDDIKAWVRAEHFADYGRRFSSRTLAKYDVDLFLKFLSDEYFGRICEIDTSPFWDDYDNFKNWAARQILSGIEDYTYRDYMFAKGAK